MGEGNFLARRALGGEFPSQEGWGRGISQPGGLGEGNFPVRSLRRGGGSQKQSNGSERKPTETTGNDQMAANGNQRKRTSTLVFSRKLVVPGGIRGGP